MSGQSTHHSSPQLCSAINDNESILLLQAALSLDRLKQAHEFPFVFLTMQGKPWWKKARSEQGIKHRVTHRGRRLQGVKGGQESRVEAECEECSLQTWTVKTSSHREMLSKDLQSSSKGVKVKGWAILVRVRPKAKLMTNAWSHVKEGPFAPMKGCTFFQHVKWKQAVHDFHVQVTNNYHLANYYFTL